MVRALVITKESQGYRSEFTQLTSQQLPDADVTLKVLYSSLNYKDALAITGNGPIVRQFPMVPGIDLVGEVVTSRDPAWQAGDHAIVTGWGMGEQHFGGLAELASVPGDWLVPLPAGLSPYNAMAIGTAGLTAMLAIMALERQQITLQHAPLLVTGSSGGVGSFSLWLLSKLGYQVFAATGDPAAEPYLRALGAQGIVPRTDLNAPAKPLAKERWAAAIDTLGSHSLANLLAATKRSGVVIACGMAQGIELPASVAPFILRGVTLQGIDSVYCPKPLRLEAWQRLADLVTDNFLRQISQSIELPQVVSTAQRLLAGEIRGRIVVNCQNQGSIE